jgi:hypothetical protein
VQVRVVSEAFRYYRMHVLQDIYFQGGFGTMQWIEARVQCCPARHSGPSGRGTTMVHLASACRALLYAAVAVVSATSCKIDSLARGRSSVIVRATQVDKYAAEEPDKIVLCHPHETLDRLTTDYKDALAAAFKGDAAECDAAVISIDARGMDVRVRHGWECSMHRVPFDALVQKPDEAARAVERALADLAPDA